MVWKHDGKNLTVGKSWTDGTYKHPYNWATSWSDEDKKDWGVTWEDDPDISFDNRFYWSKGVERKLADEDAIDSETGNKAKDAEGNQVINYGLKTIWVRQTKKTANDKISRTDWYIIRASDDSSLSVPSDITAKRKAIRDACKTIEDKILATSSLDNFKKLFDAPVDSAGKPTGDNPPIYDFPKE
jgi:hypothetical protein